MRAMARWAPLSAAAAPVLLIGGWTVAEGRQPSGFDPVTDTISALAGHRATDRWLMTAALFGLGVCHLLTALGLRPAAPAGRLVLGIGGAATLLVAAFPLPRLGASTVHGAAAFVAFTALALWPAVAWRRSTATPRLLRRPPSLSAFAVLLGLILWFAVCLSGDAGAPVGLAERIAAGAQALWPLLVVASCRRAEATSRAGPAVSHS